MSPIKPNSTANQRSVNNIYDHNLGDNYLYDLYIALIICKQTEANK